MLHWMQREKRDASVELSLGRKKKKKKHTLKICSIDIFCIDFIQYTVPLFKEKENWKY